MGKGGVAGSAERMMGSDSGLSRRSGCPQLCEAAAPRWQNRTGCQSRKVPLTQRNEKESACQTCSGGGGGEGGERKERESCGGGQAEPATAVVSHHSVQPVGGTRRYIISRLPVAADSQPVGTERVGLEDQSSEPLVTSRGECLP